MIKEMNSKILGSLATCNADVASHGHHISVSTGNMFFQTSYGLGEDENANTIGNVLKNLSHYSTPPGSPNLVPVSGALCHKENSSLPRGGRLGEDNHQLTPLAREDIEETDAVSHHDKSTLPSGSPLLRTNNQVTSGSHQSCPFEHPSFSLGLTQDKDAPAPHEDDQMGENESELSVETQHDTIISRKRQTYADSPTIFTNRLPPRVMLMLLNMVTISASQPAICRRHVLLNNLRDKVTLVSGALCHKENSSLPRGGQLDEDNHQLTPLAREDIESPAVPLGDSRREMSPLSGHSETHERRRSDVLLLNLLLSYKLHFEQPSFSLGLTQDKDAPAPREDDQMGENESELSVETQHDTIISRIRQTYADNPTIFTNRLPVQEFNTKSCPRGTTLCG
ncbi:unnamed protein product [Brassica rapa subsp. trilocularis]